MHLGHRPYLGYAVYIRINQPIGNQEDEGGMEDAKEEGRTASANTGPPVVGVRRCDMPKPKLLLSRHRHSPIKAFKLNYNFIII